MQTNLYAFRFKIGYLSNSAAVARANTLARDSLLSEIFQESYLFAFCLVHFFILRLEFFYLFSVHEKNSIEAKLLKKHFLKLDGGLLLAGVERKTKYFLKLARAGQLQMAQYAMSGEGTWKIML